MKVLLIDWVDSSGASGWIDEDRARAQVCCCQTVGFLVEETKEAIAVALSRATTRGHAPFGDMVSIPKIAIKRKKVISL